MGNGNASEKCFGNASDMILLWQTKEFITSKHTCGFIWICCDDDDDNDVDDGDDGDDDDDDDDGDCDDDGDMCYVASPLHIVFQWRHLVT